MQADRNSETVKHFHNCIKVLSQLRTPYCTNLPQYSKKREAVRMTMHRDHTYNFRFQLLRQKTVTAYDIAAVCCNSRVRENVLSSKRFTSKQGKIISLAFRIQGVIAKFWGVIFTPKNSLKRTLTFEWQTDPQAALQRHQRVASYQYVPTRFPAHQKVHVNKRLLT